MNTTSLKQIKKINEMKKEIKSLEAQIEKVRSCREYDALADKLYEAHKNMKHAAEDLVSFLTVKISLI